jgi:hypothetical protein
MLPNTKLWVQPTCQPGVAAHRLAYGIVIIRQIRWALFRNLILQLAVFFPTVYNAVPSRDRAVTETT